MRHPFLLTALSAGLALTTARGEDHALTTDQINFFEKNIRPVLVNKCYDCHSAKSAKVKANLMLDTRDGTLHGGDTGPAVVPGKLDDSLLISAIRYTDKDTQMPPQKSGGKLPDEVIANFEQWVRMGAPDPRVGVMKTAEQLSTDKAREFWSFKPVGAPSVPTVKNKAWPISDIDRFVLASLEAKGLAPIEDADPRALLRRVYFDLIGMPPPMGAMNAFVTEWSKGREAGQEALTAVVDKLLETPQYGERWGRHWLDVARYAESAGKEANDLFPTAWRYRDYVIDSFNEDKPYDLFLREQIAGDLMPARDSGEYNEHLIATTFLAIGTKNLGEKKKLQFAMDQVDEQIDAVTKSVMALTVACARCHDHKFDPVTTRDYYAMAGIFRSTETFYGTAGKGGKYNVSRLLPLADESKPLAEQADMKQATEKLLADAAAAETAARKAKKAAKKNGMGKKGYAKKDKESPQQIMHEVMGVAEGPPTNSPIYLKGEIDDPGPVVPRGLVAFLSNSHTPAVPSNGSGRMELAQWLASADNPLTARVMMNRVWQHLFGQGIVRTADNFGSTGERPTHPELLDRLAADFVSHHWSIKQMIREIVLSRVYQLSTHGDAANQQADPGNRLLWRMNPRRLDAEAIRDAMLTASGMMDLDPPRGSMVGSIGDGLASGYSDRFVNAQFHYRSIYLPIVRDFVPSCLEVFDFAEPSLVIANRDTTNVPSQALYMMNNDFVIEQAKALAHRISSVPNLDHAGRIKLAYELTLCRPPTDAERTRADKFLRSELVGLMPLNNGKTPAAAEEAYATFCQALFACGEFRYLADALPEASNKLP